MDITVFHFLKRDFKMGCVLPIALLHAHLVPREHPKWVTLFQLGLLNEKAYGAWIRAAVAMCYANEGKIDACFCKPRRFSRLFVTQKNLANTD